MVGISRPILRESVFQRVVLLLAQLLQRNYYNIRPSGLRSGSCVLVAVLATSTFQEPSLRRVSCGGLGMILGYRYT